MTCLCPLQLNHLMGSLPTAPSLASLIPVIPLHVTAAVNASLPGFVPSLSVQAMASAQLSAVANLSTMLALSAAVHAALGVNLNAPLSLTAVAQVSEHLSANIGTLNGSSIALNLAIPGLAALLAALAGLLPVIGLVAGVQAALGINLRLPGAVVALQAHLNASARLAAHANLSARVSATETMMMRMGFAFNAQGVLAASASAQAMARLMVGLPPIRVNIQALSLLAALLALLAALLSILKVDLRAPNALFQLQVALSALPLAAIAQLQVCETVSAHVNAQVNASAVASACAAAGLNLSAIAQANLGVAARVSLMMQLMAQGNFMLLPAGACGLPCPMELVASV